MKTYKETKKEVGEVIKAVGAENFLNAHINQLIANGNTAGNVYKAMSYFFYSPQAKSYRQPT